MALPEVMARLQPIPGIGPWTAAETFQRALGAADALTLDDLHLLIQIGYALTGARGGTDEQMLEVVEPYAGQRHRAARLILLGGRLPNRRAHRAPHSRIAICDTTVRGGSLQGAGQTVPRQPPVSAPRDSMNCLKRFRSLEAWRLTKPSLSPTVSARPSGS